MSGQIGKTEMSEMHTDNEGKETEALDGQES